MSGGASALRRGARKEWNAEVEIESIAAGGEGVGKLPDGRTVFVHRMAPGDRGEVRVVTERPRWARARLVRLIRPSSLRRDAPCPHYLECGGCTLEHLTYDAQLRAKGGIVAAAMTRIGRVETSPPEVVASPREHRYRNRVSFALRRLGHGRVVAGFHALHEPGRIIDIDGRCLLPEAPISAAWDALRAAWGTDARRLPAGERLRLTLRATSSGAVTLLIDGGVSSGRPEELLAAVPTLASIWQRRDGAPATHIAGEPSLTELWGEDQLRIGGSAFLQVNREAARLLEAYVLELAGDVTGRCVVDGYCGIGLFAGRLARAGASVTGIELDETAIELARKAAPPGAVFLHARVEDAIGSVLPADLVILNPPRGGLEPPAAEALATSPSDRLVYVSCDPATLARDLRRLDAVYRLRSLRAFDLFPQTAHVETVAELDRAT
jgi:23S rRNA (uracil1939-C5)-methyltransferase